MPSPISMPAMPPDPASPPGRPAPRAARALVFAAGLAATAASAGLYGLAFPPTRLRVAAFVCLVPLLLALRAVGPGSALLLAFLWAPLASAVVADALPAAVSTYFLQPLAVAWAFAIAVWVVTGSVYYVLFAALYRGLLVRAPRAALPLLTAAAWTAGELARGRLLTDSSFFVGNPWALFGYSQVDWPALIQVASWTGVYGVGFVLVAANAALAEALLAAFRRRWSRGLAAGMLAALAPVVLAWFGGVLALRGADRAPAPSVPVVVVQGNVDLGARWRSAFYAQNLDVYRDLTAEALAQDAARLVFWPEGALTFPLEGEPEFARYIARVLAPSDAWLVVGGPGQDPEGLGRHFNSVFVLSPGGDVRDRYDKRHLVPFSEFLPLERFDPVRRRFEGVASFARGTRGDPLATPAGRLGILTCNEAMLPEVAGRRVRAGAEILVNPSNDTWIAEPDWAALMFDMVSLRAVEQRRYLVRASTSGPSGLVDPWGRVLARSPPRTRAWLAGAVESRRGLSVYARVGDLFALACLGACLVALVAGPRRSQTTPSAASPRSTA